MITRLPEWNPELWSETNPTGKLIVELEQFTHAYARS
jgi:hypothetical protein